MTGAQAAIAFLAMLGVFAILRAPHWVAARRNPVADSRRSGLEATLRAIGLAGLLLLPLAEALSRLPIDGVLLVPLARRVSALWAFADRSATPVEGWVGAVLAAASMALFHATHRELGAGWSPTLETRRGHVLIRTGVYAVIRHPMYAAFFLWAAAQALLIHNWVAGLAGLVGFATLYFVRMPREEQLMLETFGEEYRTYMQQTKRLVPRLF